MVLHFYGRFLSNNTATSARTMMIKTNSPAIAGTKYISATDAAVVAVDVGVAGVVSTAKLVSEDDGQ